MSRPSTLQTELVTEEDRLAQLAEEWRGLEARAGRSSLFSSYDYVACSWRHFHRPEDRLLVGRVHERERTLAVVPLRAGREIQCGLTLRVLRWIAAWEGDRPGILSVLPDERVWEELFRALRHRFRGWDVLVLAEQDCGAVRPSPGDCVVAAGPDGEGYGISLKSGWADYWASRSGKMRHNYRRSLSRLEEECGDAVLCSCDKTAEMREGLERFARLECRSWKNQAGVGLSADVRRFEFYREVLPLLAARNGAAIHFLTAGGVDVAAAITARFKTTHYGLQIAYLPDFAKYSPGILLHGMIIQAAFQTGGAEFDMLGMHGGQSYKASWATHRYKTECVTVTRPGPRTLPLMLARRMKRLLCRAPLREEVAAA